MRYIMLIIVVLMAGTASPASAQDVPVPSRYSFTRIGEGFVRLDNVSGQVAFCSPHTVGWACEAAAEDRAALEKEIARLQDEVAGLRREVADLREPPPPRPPAELTPESKSDNVRQLREDVARARGALENVWRRLVDMIVAFQRDMMGRG
jgi:cell division protein FtsB